MNKIKTISKLHKKIIDRQGNAVYNRAVDDAIKVVEEHRKMKCSTRCLISDLEKLKK